MYSDDARGSSFDLSVVIETRNVEIGAGGEDEAEAVNLANDSEYGLAGAVWSASPDRARAVASRIRTGRVVINGAPVERAAPHGGFKRSGIGREWGRFGIEDYLELQAIHG